MRLSSFAFAPGNGGLSAAEVDELTAFDTADMAPATVGSGERRRVDKEVRAAECVYVDSSASPDWLFDRLAGAAGVANSAMWRLHLWRTHPRVQVVRYVPGNGHFVWHTDSGGDGHGNRKLTVVVQLSEADHYDGGDLEFRRAGTTWAAPRERGTIIVFPTMLSHRVTEVRSGVRHSAVTWVLGPEYW